MNTSRMLRNSKRFSMSGMLDEKMFWAGKSKYFVQVTNPKSKNSSYTMREVGLYLKKFIAKLEMRDKNIL